MKCIKCNTDMKIGIAIDTDLRNIDYYNPITYDKLKLIEVFKCSKCGYSDDGINPIKCTGIENRYKKDCSN